KYKKCDERTWSSTYSTCHSYLYAIWRVYPYLCCCVGNHFNCCYFHVKKNNTNEFQRINTGAGRWDKKCIGRRNGLCNGRNYSWCGVINGLWIKNDLSYFIFR